MNITNRQRGIRTTAIHAGEGIDPVSRASSPNLVMSSTFAPTEVAGFSARNREGYEGFVYARLSNPTVKQLEDKLAALEGAESCQCYASGMAASSALMLGRLSKGDHLVISDTNYVGTAELVRDSLPRFGIEVTPVDMSDLDMVANAITPKTRMLWVETPANPIMRLADIKALSALARARNVRASSRTVEAPPVEGAPHIVPDDRSVDAEVGPEVGAVGVDDANTAVGVAEGDEVFAEEADAHGRRVGQGHFLLEQRWQPEAPEEVAHGLTRAGAFEKFVFLLGEHAGYLRLIVTV